MTDRKKHYYGLDGIRALACIGIVLMHVLANAKYDVGGFIFLSLIPAFTNLVFLFMTISGFGLCCGYYEKIKDNKIDISDFYKKRYAKIWPFFAFMCLIDLVMSPSLGALYETFANLTLCFGFIPNADITVIGVGWFLGTVFAFYLLFPFAVFLLTDKKRAWFSAIVALAMNLICGGYFGADRKSIAYSFVYFLAGGMIFLYKDWIDGISNLRVIALLGIVISTIAYFFIDGNTFTILLINVFIVFYGISVVDRSVLSNSLLRQLGSISFEVYLCHMLIFRIVEKLNFLRMTRNEYLNYLLTSVIVLAGAILFASFVKAFIEKTLKLFKKF